MADHYFRLTVEQTVIAVAPDETEAATLTKRHLPGRAIYGQSTVYGRFEVNGTADLKITKVTPLSLQEAAQYMTRSQEVERQLRRAKGDNS